jgi:hypothetical protein
MKYFAWKRSELWNGKKWETYLIFQYNTIRVTHSKNKCSIFKTEQTALEFLTNRSALSKLSLSHYELVEIERNV